MSGGGGGLVGVVTAQVTRPLQSKVGGSCVEEAGRTSCGKGGKKYWLEHWPPDGGYFCLP